MSDDDSRAIYLAAAYSRRVELQLYAEMLEHQGHWVTSDWVLGGHELPDKASSEYYQTEWAECDLADIREADIVVQFTGGDKRGRGGRHVEFGYALALEKELVVIGERENVFHYMPDVRQFDTFAAFFDWLHSQDGGSE